MRTLHSLSNSQSSYLFTLDRRRFRPTGLGIYQNNEYIKHLNHLLTLELGIVELYSRLNYRPWLQMFQRCLANHQEIAKTVNNLIISNQGVPETGQTTLTTELSILATRLSKQFGKSFGAKTSCRVCLAMEQSMKKRYSDLIALAPMKDRHQLNEVLFITEANLISLKEISH